MNIRNIIEKNINTEIVSTFIDYEIKDSPTNTGNRFPLKQNLFRSAEIELKNCNLKINKSIDLKWNILMKSEFSKGAYINDNIVMTSFKFNGENELIIEIENFNLDVTEISFYNDELEINISNICKDNYYIPQSGPSCYSLVFNNFNNTTIEILEK